MYDLVVLGGGSGGLNVATAAAAVGAKVALIEKHKLGGECTHTACVPSKALLHAANLARQITRSESYGIKAGAVEVDFAVVMNRVREVVSSFAGSDSGNSLKAKGIDVYRGSPAFDSYDTILLDGTQRIVGQRFVIATGSRSNVPPIPGLKEAGYLTNETVWDLNVRPESLAVLGGGPVGLELAQAFARLGSKVTILELQDRILPNEDPEVSERLLPILRAEGIEIQTGVEVQKVESRDGRKVLCYKRPAERSTGSEANAHEILVAVGRLANVEGLNLEAIGIEADPKLGIPVDDYLQTYARTVYAIGDVIGHHQWTHAAEREASVVFQNALLRIPKKIDYSAMPWATFTDPEVATVGRTHGYDPSESVRIFRTDYDELDRARIDGRTQGFAKLVTTPSGQILGVTILGDNAALVLQEFVFAMEHGRTLNDVVNTVHPYPTHAGLARTLANEFAATRLEKGYIRSALQWFYGFSPRVGSNGRQSEPMAAEAQAGEGQAH